MMLYPARHFVTPEPLLKRALIDIRDELTDRLIELREQGKLVEAQRLESRTLYDLEMLQEMGHCPGVENYSRHLSGRKPGERPLTLIDYFPDDFMTIIDESHVTVPQLNGMFFADLINECVYVSATPNDYELTAVGGEVVEQVIRPTGLVDPEILVRPARGQVDDLVGEVQKRVEKQERVLVTTLTKRMAEELTDYLSSLNIRVRYLHSDINALERVEILRGLRLGDFDVLVGINLLREGLDLPEVSLVAVCDADKEGFLRSETSLIQTSGRAARHVSGKVVFYADAMTDSMKRAIGETNRRRTRQLAYNDEHGVIPRGIVKSLEEVRLSTSVADAKRADGAEVIYEGGVMATEEIAQALEEEMLREAQALNFEKAASLRDRLEEVRIQLAMKSQGFGTGKRRRGARRSSR
jgi:excinuclease ABC subunit B